ncbi:unnamed protein product, partial [Staurois parvus]
FTISGLPQCTQHGNAISLGKYKLLNTFFSSELELVTSAEHWLNLLGGVFFLLKEDVKPLTLCLDSADWPCADHMHPPKKKKKPL